MPSKSKKNKHAGDKIEGGAECDICHQVVSHLTSYKRHLKTVHEELSEADITARLKMVSADKLGEKGERFRERRPCAEKTCRSTFNFIAHYVAHMRDEHGVENPDLTIARNSDR